MQTQKLVSGTILLLVLVTALIGCGTGSTPPTSAGATNAPATVAIVTQTPLPAPTTAGATNAPVTEAPAATAPNEPTGAAANGDETVTLVVVPEKSEARYRVREQLAGVSLPSDAIGRTNAISGQIVGKMDGTIDSANSKIVVDVRTLKSDQGARDRFIQGTPLQTGQFPTVTFVPTSAPGLPLTVPESGQSSFQLVGDLTVKDVTKPTTWEANCELVTGQTEGKCTATTTFTFEDFNLEQPRVGRVVSIEDHITLEVDMYLQRVTP